MRKVILTTLSISSSLSLFAQSSNNGEVTDDILGIVIGGGILLALVIGVNKWRNKNYSRKCPNCNRLVHPRTTGLKNQYSSCYTYKCSNCGHTFTNY